MWNDELKARFLKTDPAAYGHFNAVRFMAPKIKPLSPEFKLCGPAYTVKLYGKDHFAVFKALEEAPAGSVIVIDKSGDEVYAPVGEFIARQAIAMGIAGFVIDGPATDSAYLKTFEDLPVFCSGLSPVTCSLFALSGETQADISCGGAVVHPGDIILGDCDGVVVLPSKGYEAMLERAELMAERESAMRAEYEAGRIPEGVFPPIKDLDMAGLQGVVRAVIRGELDPGSLKK